MSEQEQPHDTEHDDPLPSATANAPEQCPGNNEDRDRAHEKNSGKRWSKSDLWMVIFTGTIAAWTAAYSIVAWFQLQEIHAGSRDTHELAVAAQQQARQAQAQTVKMKEALERTDKLIAATAAQATAATSLAAQARRSADIAAKASAANEQSVRDSRRPWVGLREFRCEECVVDAENALSVGKMFGVMENTGRTPAVQMTVTTIWAGRKADDPAPDYESIDRETKAPPPFPSNVPPEVVRRFVSERDEALRKAAPPPTVLPPGALRVLPIMGRLKTGSRKHWPPKERSISYVIGRISYYDTERKRRYETRFCLMNDFGPDFRFCPSGNDMK